MVDNKWICKYNLLLIRMSNICFDRHICSLLRIYQYKYAKIIWLTCMYEFTYSQRKFLQTFIASQWTFMSQFELEQKCCLIVQGQLMGWRNVYLWSSLPIWWFCCIIFRFYRVPCWLAAQPATISNHRLMSIPWNGELCLLTLYHNLEV